MNNHEFFMRRAIELALMGKGRVSPNPMVGAVIVKDGRIIAEGCHREYGGLHAERDAFSRLREPCGGADLYVTLEPCAHVGKQPPCTEAIISHGIKRVFVGSDDPNPLVNGKGNAILREHGIEVKTGILKDECDSINRPFFHYIQTGTPYIVCKYAMTADGKIAAVGGDSKWISCDKSRRLVHEMRAEYKGIMVGINTVLADDPMLNCRIPDCPSPIRIICDTQLRLPPDSKIAKTASEYRTIIATASEDYEKRHALEKMGVEILDVSKKDGHLNLTELSRSLGKLRIDGILAEGGAELNFSLLKEGLCRRLYVFIAPKIVGGQTAKTPVGGVGIDRLDNCIRLSAPRISNIGDDILLDYEVI